MSARRKQLIALSVVLVCVVGMAVYGIVRVSNKTADKGSGFDVAMTGTMDKSRKEAKDSRSRFRRRAITPHRVLHRIVIRDQETRHLIQEILVRIAVQSQITADRMPEIMVDQIADRIPEIAVDQIAVPIPIPIPEAMAVQIVAPILEVIQIQIMIQSCLIHHQSQPVRMRTVSIGRDTTKISLQSPG